MLYNNESDIIVIIIIINSPRGSDDNIVFGVVAKFFSLLFSVSMNSLCRMNAIKRRLNVAWWLSG